MYVYIKFITLYIFNVLIAKNISRQNYLKKRTKNSNLCI